MKALSTLVESSAEASRKLQLTLNHYDGRFKIIIRENISYYSGEERVQSVPELVVSREKFPGICRDLSLLHQVGLVAEEHDVDVLVVGVVPHVLHPPGHVVERLLVGDVVEDDGPEGVPVVGGGDGPVPLLARRIPDLDLHRLTSYQEGLGGELHPDGGLGVQAELVPGKPREEAGLAHPGVPDQDDLEEVVVVVLSRAPVAWIETLFPTIPPPTLSPCILSAESEIERRENDNSSYHGLTYCNPTLIRKYHNTLQTFYHSN